MQIHYFQRYYAKENVETANTMLMLSRLYQQQGKAGKGLNFGVIVTFKSIDGENRIDDFIKLCMVRGLLVTPVDVQNQIDIYQQAEEEIIFD